MWAIFLIATFGFAIAALGLIWIGNKVLNAMRRDDYKTEKEFNDKITEE